MGKKSKKGAVSKSTLGAANSTGGKAAAVGTSSSKSRCAGCCALLKDLVKSHQCPGCSQLFCWRCEKKCIEECPNGANCVRRVRRCLYCWNAATFTNNCGGGLLVQKGNSQERAEHLYITTETFKLFRDNVNKNDALTIDAFPFLYCVEEGCKQTECHMCFSGPAVSRLIGCSVCYKSRCQSCNTANLREFQVPTVCNNILNEAMDASRKQLTPDEVRLLGSALRDEWPDLYFICSCGEAQCYACLDDRAVENYYRCMLMSDEFVNIPPTWSEESDYKCGRCYWSSKPCTNPNCPNEVGIPTKRCGGCHLDRYCSVECQAAAYPEHMERCHKIQAKRAATVGVEKKV